MQFLKGESVLFSVLIKEPTHKHGYCRLDVANRKVLNNLGFSGKGAKTYHTHNMVNFKGNKHPLIEHPHYGPSIILK